MVYTYHTHMYRYVFAIFVLLVGCDKLAPSPVMDLPVVNRIEVRSSDVDSMYVDAEPLSSHETEVACLPPKGPHGKEVLPWQARESGTYHMYLSPGTPGTEPDPDTRFVFDNGNQELGLYSKLHLVTWVEDDTVRYRAPCRYIPPLPGQ